jgi:FAD-dependent halogenase
MSIANESFDVVVIGGGPAGSTLSTLVAMQGRSVLQIEREQFPRHQIGESLLPPTIGLCHRMGLGEALDNAGFTPKNGGVWYWGSQDKPGWGFNFAEGTQKPLFGKAWAYQVERSKFDQLLLRNAQSKGVVVREQHRVEEILYEKGRVAGVRYQDGSGKDHIAHARYVVDAAGNTSQFHKLVGKRLFADRFRNLALYCYFAGGKRLPAPQSGSILIVSFDKGWFWYIPLAPDLTSVGVVISVEHAHLLRNGHEEAMKGFLNATPMIREYLGDTPRITSGPYGQYRVRKDWSYVNTKFHDQGLVLVGDAACFVDPLFSSGVHLATYSAFLAARSIVTSLEHPELEQRAFDAFEELYRREYRYFFDFLSFFYDVNKDKEEYFQHARELMGTHDQDKVAFVKLVAAFPALADIDTWHTGSGGVAKNAVQMEKSAVFPEGGPTAFRESPGSAEVTHVVNGSDQPGAPAAEVIHGLVPSEDGTRWRVA